MSQCGVAHTESTCVHSFTYKYRLLSLGHLTDAFLTLRVQELRIKIVMLTPKTVWSQAQSFCSKGFPYPSSKATYLPGLRNPPAMGSCCLSSLPSTHAVAHLLMIHYHASPAGLGSPGLASPALRAFLSPPNRPH